MSITGRGSGGVPMMFAVDVHENRRQRSQMGEFLKLCGVSQPGDWVLSIHTAGGFYRYLGPNQYKIVDILTKKQQGPSIL